MAIATKCPKCNATFRLGDEMAGKKVKCQRCQNVFEVPEEKPAPQMEIDKPEVLTAVEAPKPKKPSKVADEDEAPAPKKKAGPPPISKSSSKSSKPPARPKRRSEKASSGGGSGAMIFILLFGGFALLSCVGCVGVAGFWAFSNHKPGPIAGNDKGVIKKDFNQDKFDANRDQFKDKDGVDGNKDKDAGKDKDGPPFDGNKDKDGPPLDGNKDRDSTIKDKDLFKDKKDRPPFDGIKDLIKDKDGLIDKKVPFPPGKPTIVQFDKDGMYRSESSIEANAPRNQQGKLHKRYAVLMQAGQFYQIDMRNTPYDAYLYLIEPPQTVVAQDDDGGGYPNARIMFQAKKTGPYFIDATSLGGQGTGKFTLYVRRSPDNVVFNPPQEFDLGEVSARVFNAEQGQRFVGDLIWARDGKSFYALTESGVLQRRNASSGIIEAKNNLGKRCGNLAQSGQGLLVSVSESNEIWVIHPNNLAAVTRKIPVQNVTRVTAGINSRFAIAGPNSLKVIDLERGMVVQQYPNLNGFNITASPDGKYLFAQSDGQQLVRYRIDGTQLIEEDQSPRIATNGNGIFVSPDNQYVCLAAGGGNGRGHPDHPPVPNDYVTYIYPVTNLKKPAFALPTGAYPQAVAFDPKGGHILAQNVDKALLLHNFVGVKKNEFGIPTLGGGDVREFSFSPLGNEVLLRANERIAYVKLKQGDPVAKVELPKKVDGSVITRTTKLDGFVQHELSLIANVGPILGATDPCWDKDGKHLYWLNGTRLQKVEQATMKLVAATDLPLPCRVLAMSSEGLLTLPPASNDVWVIDPATLAVRNKISAPGARWVGASPTSSTAIVLTNELAFLDLKGGKTISTKIVNSPAGLGTIRSLAVSPDGKYLFVHAQDTFHRLRIESNQFVHEESKQGPAKVVSNFQIAPDGKSMTMVYPTSIPTSVKMIKSTEIFPLDSWAKANYLIPHRLRQVVFDPAGGLYAQGEKGELRYYRDPAKASNQFLTVAPPTTIRRIFGPPHGGGVLVLPTNGPAFWIERSAQN